MGAVYVAAAGEEERAGEDGGPGEGVGGEEERGPRVEKAGGAWGVSRVWWG